MPIANRVRQTTTTTGSAQTLSLIAPALGRQSFVAGVGNGNQTFALVIEGGGTGNWEIRRGTVTSGSPDTLSYIELIDSSSGSPINFGAGTHDVVQVLPAEKFVFIDTDGALKGVTGDQLITAINSGSTAIADARIASTIARDSELPVNPVSTSRQIATQHSLTGGGDLSADRTINLVNDTASPGNSKYYGTDSGGTRGWHDIGNGARAWVHFTVSGGTPTIQGQANVGSVVRNSTGNFTINFAVALSSAVYSVIANAPLNSTGNAGALFASCNTFATGSFRVHCTNGTGSYFDPALVTLAVF